MHIRSILVTVLLSGLLPWGAARADMTIHQYLAIEKGQAGVRPDFSVVYLAGLLAGLQAANGVATAEGRPIFCPGERTLAPTVVELKPGIDEAIAKASAEQPGFDRYARIVTIGMVGLTALTSLYPCPESPAPAAGPGAGEGQANR